MRNSKKSVLIPFYINFLAVKSNREATKKMPILLSMFYTRQLGCYSAINRAEEIEVLTRVGGMCDEHVIDIKWVAIA